MSAALPAFKKILGALGLFLIGAVFGPLLFAALAAFSPAKGKFGDSIESIKLVDAYRDELPEQILWMSILPPDSEYECGYETDSVFSDDSGHAEVETPMLDYAAYLTLIRWRNEQADSAWISRITEKIDSSFSDYQKSFLRRCIETTLFKANCMKVVEDFGNNVKRFADRDGPKSPEELISSQILCNFVDGVAARKGIALKTEHRSTSK
jgi:hypothetical protein